jgi:hypothetical protein
MLDKNNRVLAVNDHYLPRLFQYYGISFEQVGRIIKVKDFVDYNYLVDINAIFSSNPKWYPVDRTGSVYHPVNWEHLNVWQAPLDQLTLEHALESRVKELIEYNQTINLYWSGGIDSTAMLTAFLKHCKNLDQLRIIYSPWSTYEHPGYIDFLRKFPGLELIDQSGEYYLNANLDGIHITGDGGDEYNASIDESFLESHGYQTLHRNWIDFFREQGASESLITFCVEYFAKSQRPIETVLEARWWFYMICKNRSILSQSKLPFFSSQNQNNFDPSKLQGFFDCSKYESYIYWNTDKIMPTSEYSSWKQHLKKYCYEFDGMETWYLVKTKFGSSQFDRYSLKKNILNDTRWIFILSDGTRISTPNMPLISKKELDLCYGDSLQVLFNEPK